MTPASFTLETLQVASPCAASWASMAGDEHVRFCAHCRQNVYNLSGMTRTDAETLLRKKEGRLCVRYFQRADGTIVTSDCSPEQPQSVLRRLWLALLFGIFLPLWLLFCCAELQDRGLIGSPSASVRANPVWQMWRWLFPPPRTTQFVGISVSGELGKASSS